MYIVFKNNHLKSFKPGGATGFLYLFPGLILGLILLLANPVSAASNIDDQKAPGKGRLQSLVIKLQLERLSEKAKVEAVNVFYNNIPRAHDSTVWGRKDYWATPDELLSQYKGDCEDVAIAKYFTLRELGVSDSRLRLAYGKIADLERGRIEPHMVLIYMPDNAQSLVLDSLNSHMLGVSERQDLILEYIFNMTSVWRWQKTAPVLLGKAEVLEPWRDLLKRL